MCKVPIALQELQVVVQMLCRMAFHLSGNVVALHLHSNTAKAIIMQQSIWYNIFFLFRLSYYILNLADKHDIAVIPAYIHIHVNVEGNYLSWGLLIPK